MMEDVLVPFFVFAIPSALVVLLVWMKTREKERNTRYMMQSNLYAKALEKGESLPPLPDTLFAEPPADKNKMLRRAIIFLAVGIGFFVTMWVMAEIVAGNGWHDAADSAVGVRIFGALGIIPFLVGLGFLVIHLIEKTKRGGEKAE